MRQQQSLFRDGLPNRHLIKFLLLGGASATVAKDAE
jgi:hypothetical protein